MNHAPTCTIAIKTAEVSGVMECNAMHPWLPTQLLDGSLDDACTSSHLVERQKQTPVSFDRIDGSVVLCVTVVRGVCAAQGSDAAKPGPSATFANTGRWPGFWGMPADLLLEAHPGHLCLSVSHSRSTQSMGDLHTNHPFPHEVGGGFCVGLPRVALVWALAQGGRAILGTASCACYGHWALGRLAW